MVRNCSVSWFCACPSTWWMLEPFMMLTNLLFLLAHILFDWGYTRSGFIGASTSSISQITPCSCAFLATSCDDAQSQAGFQFVAMITVLHCSFWREESNRQKKAKGKSEALCLFYSFLLGSECYFFLVVCYVIIKINSCKFVVRTSNFVVAAHKTPAFFFHAST